MNQDEIIRYNLLALLTGKSARMSFDDCVRSFPMDRINESFPNADYSPWDLLEHTRLAQEDILDFIINPDYKNRNFPNDYWPPKGKKATPADWENTVNGYKKDLDELENMVKNPETDLYYLIPWGTGQTLLREIITVSNHNDFHLGEFAIMRQVMGTWGETNRM
ncbi:DinB family protein [Chloroflexota bacterium]